MEGGVWIPLVAGLAGALIGSAGSVAVVLIQAWKEDKRHRRDVATRLAIDSRAAHIDLVKAQGGVIFPIELYLAHSVGILDAIETGTLSPAKLDALSEAQSALRQAVMRNMDKP